MGVNTNDTATILKHENYDHPTVMANADNEQNLQNLALDIEEEATEPRHKKLFPSAFYW